MGTYRLSTFNCVCIHYLSYRLIAATHDCLRKHDVHCKKLKKLGSGGIRTHASEETDALNQRLRPLGHATEYRVAGICHKFTFNHLKLLTT